MRFLSEEIFFLQAKIKWEISKLLVTAKSSELQTRKGSRISIRNRLRNTHKEKEGKLHGSLVGKIENFPLHLSRCRLNWWPKFLWENYARKMSGARFFPLYPGEQWHFLSNRSFCKIFFLFLSPVLCFCLPQDCLDYLEIGVPSENRSMTSWNKVQRDAPWIVKTDLNNF